MNEELRRPPELLADHQALADTAITDRFVRKSMHRLLKYLDRLLQVSGACIEGTQVTIELVVTRMLLERTKHELLRLPGVALGELDRGPQAQRVFMVAEDFQFCLGLYQAADLYRALYFCCGI